MWQKVPYNLRGDRLNWDQQKPHGDLGINPWWTPRDLWSDLRQM